jgi:hypothetical protein
LRKQIMSIETIVRHLKNLKTWNLVMLFMIYSLLANQEQL